MVLNAKRGRSAWARDERRGAVLDVRRVQPRQLQIQTFRPITLDPRTINFQVLRRGVVAFGHVAYLWGRESNHGG